MRLLRLAAALCSFLAVRADSNLTNSQTSQQILPRTFKPPQVFKNVNLLRNINLEKAYVRETINVVVENVAKEGQSEYYLPFDANTIGKIGGLEVADKKAPEKGRFDAEVVEYDPDRYIPHTSNQCPRLIVLQLHPILPPPLPLASRPLQTAHSKHILPYPHLPKPHPSLYHPGRQTIPLLQLLSLHPLCLSNPQAENQA